MLLDHMISMFSLTSNRQTIVTHARTCESATQDAQRSWHCVLSPGAPAVVTELPGNARPLHLLLCVHASLVKCLLRLPGHRLIHAVYLPEEF